MANPKLCLIPECGKPHLAKGFCAKHYARNLRRGGPTKGRTPDGEPQRFLIEVALTYRGKDCLTWPYAMTTSGYGKLIWQGGTRVASRVVCEMIHGAPPSPKHEAAHSCGKGHLGCVNPGHLEWKTKVGNMADRKVHGTALYGEKNGTAKLTADDVVAIRAMAITHPRREIANRFQIGITTVGEIIRGDSWPS